MLFTPGHPVRIFCLTLLVSLLGTASGPGAQAQPVLEPGYIITASGDTTRGFVENLEWQRAPREVQFAEREEGEVRVLTVTDIAGFGVGDYVFERHHLKVDQRPVERGNPYPTGHVLKRDTLFLRQLVTGSLTLYSSYTTRPHYFIETDAHGIEELVYFVRPVERNGEVRGVKRAEFFQQQLTNRRTEACSNASVRGVDFQRSELVDFVQSCNPGEQRIAFSRYRVGHVFSVQASWVSSKHTGVSDPATLSGFSPGVQYQLLVESRQRYSRGAFLLGVGLQRIWASRPEESTQREVSPSLTIRRTETGELTATVLDINAGARLRMRKADWRPFVGLEGAVLFPLTYDASLGSREEYLSATLPDAEPIRIQTGAQEWTAFQFGAGVSIGVEGPRFGTSLRFFRGFGYRTGNAEAPRLGDVQVQMFIRL